MARLRLILTHNYLVFIVALSLALLGVLLYFVYELAYSHDSSNLSTIIFIGIGIFILLIFMLIFWHKARQAQKNQAVRLQIRLIVIFSLLLIVPSVILNGFSLQLIELGINNWFSEPVNNAIRNSYSIAQAYREEHVKNIESDALNIARAIDNNLIGKPNTDNENLAWQLQLNSSLRGIKEAFIFTPNAVLSRYGLSFSMELDPLEKQFLERAKRGEVVIFRDKNEKIRALVAMTSITNGFLMIQRDIDPAVIEHLAKTQESFDNYNQIEYQRFNIQLSITQAVILLTLILLVISITIIYIVATKFTNRLGELSEAANRVKNGDFSVRLIPDNNRDEISRLRHNFNRMTFRLAHQNIRIQTANQKTEDERQFIATTLAALSQGVMSITTEGIINLCNKSACDLLKKPENLLINNSIIPILPQVSDLLSQAKTLPQGEFSQIITPIHHEATIIQIRVAYLGEAFGFVLTLDDLTPLIVAERQAAWSDVARRIAHEVKNPLTPIQLSAERLRRKYLSHITFEPQIFEQCINTIIRQVADIGRLIDEFSKFARMPVAQKSPINILEILREVIFLEQSRNSNLKINYRSAQSEFMQDCDKSLMAQVFTNIIKNAHEALEKQENPVLDIIFSQENKQNCLIFRDNGNGFPVPINNVFEPYVTTKSSGSGLGLAITKKILEDHGYKIALRNRTDDDGKILGAEVMIIFIP